MGKTRLLFGGNVNPELHPHLFILGGVLGYEFDPPPGITLLCGQLCYDGQNPFQAGSGFITTSGAVFCVFFLTCWGFVWTWIRVCMSTGQKKTLFELHRSFSGPGRNPTRKLQQIVALSRVIGGAARKALA